MRAHVRFAAIVAIIALLVGYGTERYLAAGLSYDALLTLRHLAFGDRHAGTDPPVVVVNLDEATFTSRGFRDIPLALWGPQFATVLDALDRAGAKVIGVDIIFSTTAETVVRGHDRPFMQVLQRLGAAERVVLAQTDAGGKVLAPHKIFQVVVGHLRNIRSANVPFSRDGAVRAVSLWQTAGGGANIERIPAFALTVAQRAGFDPGRLPPAMRVMTPNYGDAVIAPVYTMQDVHRCASAGAIGPLAAAFAGKVVMLGAALDVEDRKVTSGRAFVDDAAGLRSLPCADRVEREEQRRRTIPGVFIHAQAVNDLLRGEIARFWPGWLGMLTLLGFSVWGGALAVFLRAPAASLLMAATLVLWAAGATWSASLDWFAPLLGAATSAIAAFLIGLGLRNFVIDRERRKIALALSRYLDFRLAQQLIASDHPPELGGETRDVTIWFSDIAGFSTLAEHMDARELVSQLNAHFTMIGAAIEAEGGIVDKYVGDAVVAIFGAPVPMVDHAARAMRAALAVQERLRAEAGKPGAFRIRIGLNTGSCVVGNVGSDRRFDYTAIGDSVNVAARLEGANRDFGTMILASESTVRAAGPGFRCRPLGPIHVKGRAEPVVVQEVLELHAPA